MESNNLPTTTNTAVAKAEDVIEPAVDNAMQVVINCVKKETRADKIALLNALDSADKRVTDCIGQVITVKGIYAETHYSKKKEKQVCRTLVIDDQGVSYATGSFVFMNSLKAIMDVFGAPTDEEPLKIQIVEKPMERGNAITAKVVE